MDATLNAARGSGSVTAIDIATYNAQQAEKAAHIWRTLSAINVNDHAEKKNGHTYLSWAWAWGVLMEHFPSASFTFETFYSDCDINNDGVFRYPDGTADVRCILTIDGITRTMWLPVMDHRNNAIKNPNARDINDAKMRCLVKAMALFGLGHYIYAGEDVPDASKADTRSAPERNEEKPNASKSDPVEQLRSELNSAKTLDDLKAAFLKASKYAKNRNDDELLKRFTTLKDDLKAKLG